MKSKVLINLSAGQENAKTGRFLKDILKCSLRDVTKEINLLRNNGIVILSSTDTDSPGYFLPATRDEVKHVVLSMKSRMREIGRSLESAELLLNTWPEED